MFLLLKVASIVLAVRAAPVIVPFIANIQNRPIAFLHPRNSSGMIPASSSLESSPETIPESTIPESTPQALPESTPQEPLLEATPQEPPTPEATIAEALLKSTILQPARILPPGTIPRFTPQATTPQAVYYINMGLLLFLFIGNRRPDDLSLNP